MVWRDAMDSAGKALYVVGGVLVAGLLAVAGWIAACLIF